MNSVLVIDDDPVIQDLMTSFLNKEGYRVSVAANGEEGLQRARELRPDVITLDVAMPGMDGMDLARICRELRPGLPILFMSGFVDANAVRLKIWDDGVRFLSKPFTEDTIVGNVCELLGAAPLPTDKPQRARAASVN